MGLDSLFVRPIYGAFVKRLQQFPVGGEREKLTVLIPHIIAPRDPIEPISGIPDHVQKRQIRFEQMGKHILAPRRIIDQRTQQSLRAHRPRMGDVKAEPQVRLHPRSLRFPDGNLLLEVFPVHPVPVGPDPVFGFLPAFGISNREIQKFRRGSRMFPVFQCRSPRGSVSLIFLGFLKDLFFIPR